MTSTAQQSPGSVQHDTAEVTVVEPAAAAAASSSTGSTLRLATLCTVREASELRLQMLKLLETSEIVRIDAAGVQRVDTAALQLLVAFVRERSDAKRTVAWDGCSTAFLQAAQRLGLESALALRQDP